MSKRSQASKSQSEAVGYVSLYKGEPVSFLSEQIQSCLQDEAVRQQATVTILGDIEDPKISIGEISLSYPPFELTIVKIIPHNGKWSGFHLLAVRKG